MDFSEQHGQRAALIAFKAAFQGRTSGKNIGEGHTVANRPRTLDETDHLIVEALRSNACISMRELGRLVHLSGQAAKNCVGRLEEAGVLRRFIINVNCPFSATRCTPLYV